MIDNSTAHSIERELVIELINGSETAFCELYCQYKNRLVYFAQKFIKSKELAEDIFQDAFSAIWHNRQFIDPEGNFSSYLYTIMRNRVYNQLTSMEREKQFRDLTLSKAIDEDNETEKSVHYNELEKLLEKAYQTLTPQQYKVFQLSRNKMLSNKEIADELGISINTVQQHISTSLKSIRNFLSHYPDLYASLVLLYLHLYS